MELYQLRTFVAAAAEANITRAANGGRVAIWKTEPSFCDLSFVYREAPR